MELTVTQRFFQVQIFIIINALGKKVNIILESYRIYSKLNRFKYFMPGTRSTPNPVEWWKPSIINGQSMKFDVSLITPKKGFGVWGQFWRVCGACARATQLSRAKGSHPVLYQVLSKMGLVYVFDLGYYRSFFLLEMLTRHNRIQEYS